MKLELNDPVTILRGGIDGFPQVSLDNIPGRICSTHPSALPGMLSVWVDWSQTRYADVEGLPNIINNFAADLQPGHAPPKPKPKFKPKFKFHLDPINLDPELNQSDPAGATDDSRSQNQDRDDDAPPKLRLV